MIDITLLGTGATLPTPERALSAAVLRCCGRAILFDCGEGTQIALRRCKISPVKIDAIALTHFHGDHIFGLPGLLQTLSCMGREGPLSLIGPAGLVEVAEPILDLAGPLSYPVRLYSTDVICDLGLHEMHPGWPQGASLLPFPTEHRISSQGYVFDLTRLPSLDLDFLTALGIPRSLWKRLQQEDPDRPLTIDGEPLLAADGRPLLVRDVHKDCRKGLQVIFTGDTMPCQGLAALAHEPDLLIHDATYARDEDADAAAKWGHSTFRQAAELAREVRAKRLWLTHFSQIVEEPEAHLDPAKEIFPHTECGRDGMSLRLDFAD